MTTVRKKRLKIKKKNFTIFLICIFLIICSIYYGITLITKSIHKKDTLTPYPKTDNMYLNEYNKMEKEIKFYKKENAKRYSSYQKLNPNKSLKEIVLEVNIGLDNPYYENSKKAITLNKDTILVNKYNYLDEDYVPDNLENISSKYALANKQMVKKAKEAFEQMASDAKKESLSIIAMSAYRSYDYQVNLYNNYTKTDGKEKADTYSGRPGYSEHQTGLAVDVYNGKTKYTEFHNTKEFTWMQNNGYKYGFILRFPKDKTKETGYEYESWHYRYVGVDIATYIHNNNLCYEEYYAEFLDN